jgi:SAM-dependent methyltransferase
MRGVRSLIRSLLRPVLRIPVVRRARQRVTRRAYVSGGRLPWSPGYLAVREQLVTATLDDPALVRRFGEGRDLPPGHGVALDERCVEYPWLFARLGERNCRLLDAGSTLNHANLVTRPELAARELHILTLAPEHQAFWQLGISYLYADLRDIPIRDAYYDEVVCASTLEHVGADNTLYVAGRKAFEAAAGEGVDAIRELARVLKPGGRLLVTVPFGRRADHGTFVQFDAPMLAEVSGAFPGTVASSAFYRYSADGWQKATEEECAELDYAAETARASAEGRPPDPERFDSDLAAAARAVAGIELLKS